MTFERERQIPPRDNVEKKREEESVNDDVNDDDGRAVRALTKKKATTKREEKEKKSVCRLEVAPAECSRLNRDMMSLSNRIFSLNGLSRQRVVQKLDAQRAEIESSLPLSFQLRKKKKHRRSRRHKSDVLDSPSRARKSSSSSSSFKEEKYIIERAFSLEGGWVPFHREVLKKWV